MSFPISLQVQEREDVLTTFGTELRGVDLARLVVEFGALAPVAVVFEERITVPDEIIGTGEMAAEMGIRMDVYETLGGREMLVMATVDLPAFFDAWPGFGGYDVDVIDLSSPPAGEDAEEICSAVDRSWERPMTAWQRRLGGRRPSTPPSFRAGYRWGSLGPAVLSSLETPTMYYHGHDECYFAVESRTDRLPRLILRRLLALKAGAAWRRQKVIVPDPAEDVAAQLLDESREWVGEMYESTVESVTIELSPIGWWPGKRVPRKPAYVAVFHIPAQQWELRRVVR